MTKCPKCNQNVGFLNGRYDFINEEGKRVSYCVNCGEKKQKSDQERRIKEKEKNICHKCNKTESEVFLKIKDKRICEECYREKINKDRPEKTTLAINLLLFFYVLSFIIAIISWLYQLIFRREEIMALSLLYYEGSFLMALFDPLLGAFFGLGFIAYIFMKLDEGRNWARLIIILFVPIMYWMMFFIDFGIPQNTEYNILSILGIIIHLGVHITSLILLLLPETWRWFSYMGKINTKIKSEKNKMG
jgi:Zn ribbon nucleic-acid-binding protein